MMLRRVPVWLRVVVTIAATVVVYTTFIEEARQLEASASAWLLRVGSLWQVPHRVLGSAVLVDPVADQRFYAVVTASCSSLASLLAIACLATLTPRSAVRPRWQATLAALAVVAAGNLARITLSLAAGTIAGRSALILFHDWVGSAFTFVYTLGGYVVLLYLLLPDNRNAPRNLVRAG